MNRKERRAAGKHGDAVALVELAQKERNTEKAIATYRKALALDPAFYQAHNNLGRILHGQGLLGEALFPGIPQMTPVLA